MRRWWSLRCGRFTLTLALFVTTSMQARESWFDVAAGPAVGALPAFLAVALNGRRRLGARFPGLLLEWG